MDLLVCDAEKSLKLLCERFLMRDVVEVLFMMGDQFTNYGVHFFKVFQLIRQK